MNGSAAGTAGHLAEVLRLSARLCEQLCLPAERTAALLDCVGQFGGAALARLPEGAHLRRPSLHLDGTPVQFSASLTPGGTGGVRVVWEPGALTEPVSAQIALSLQLLDRQLQAWGWQACCETVNAVAGALLPAEAAQADGWWGGLWLGVVAHPRQMGLRVYCNLRSGDDLSRWRRVGKAFAALSGAPVCPAMEEIVQCAAGTARPVGLGLDLAGGRPHTLKLYVAFGGVRPDVIERLLPPCVGAGARLALNGFLGRFGALPDQSVTCAYDVPLDSAGVPAGSVKRFKVDVDAARVLTADAEALWVARATAVDAGLQQADLDALLDVLQIRPDAPAAPDGGRTFQYLGLGLGDEVANLNLYLRPAGFSAAGRTAGGGAGG